jgi:hypothetical protein
MLCCCRISNVIFLPLEKNLTFGKFRNILDIPNIPGNSGKSPQFWNMPSILERMIYSRQSLKFWNSLRILEQTRIPEQFSIWKWSEWELMFKIWKAIALNQYFIMAPSYRRSALPEFWDRSVKFQWKIRLAGGSTLNISRISETLELSSGLDSFRILILPHPCRTKSWQNVNSRQLPSRF